MAFIFFKKTRMFDAVYRGDIARATEMLDRGIDVNMRNDNHASLLEQAVYYGRTEIALMLLNRGAPLGQRVTDGFYGGTLLHLAVRRGQVPTARMLLDRDVTLVNKKDDRGCAPLHIAARDGHMDLAILLVERGADTEQRDNENRTPLFRAQETRREDMIALLRPYHKDWQPPATMPQPQSSVIEGWHKIAHDKIAHVGFEKTIGYRITEIFNFSGRGERIRLFQNLDSKAETCETKSFDDIADKAMLEYALAELQKRGGEGKVATGGMLSKKPPLL